ncbi:MAG: ATP-binding protein [Myxococcota bacterium]
MKRSFLKLVVSSVLTCWAIGFVIISTYGRSQSWADDRAKTDGVFLAYELLNELPAPERAQRLRELQPHFPVELSLMPIDDVEQRLDRPLEPGEQVPQRLSVREEWYFLAFDDGAGALAAGPAHSAVPPGIIPIGVILAVVSLPLIAGVIALRVQRQLSKVERASNALATGELTARVDNPDGPSRELAASFNAMADRVERLVRSRDELVQAVSHELGSPLSRLRFQMELLENQTGETREARLQAMGRELDALEELVAELLGYVQSDDVDLDRRAFDPNQGLRDIAELATLDAQEESTVDVAVELPKEATVMADPRLFHRAVENVLRNAVRHAQRTVRIELTEDDEHVRVTVHDDGPGIPKELRDKVTNPFFRLEGDRGRKTGGVGLGLAIVNRIMERHQGRLAIASSPLGGAMVTTLWPRVD